MQLLCAICTIVFSCAALFCPHSNNAQENHTFTLNECLQYGLKNSPKQKKEAFSRELKNIQRKEQESRYLPQVNGYANFFHYFDLPNYVFQENEGDILSGGTVEGPFAVEIGEEFNLYSGIRIDQKLFDYNLLLRNDFKESRAKITGLQSELTNEETIFEIATNYYKTLSIRASREIIDENKEHLQKLKDIMQLQYENDLITQTDLQRIEVKIVNLNSKMQRLNSGLEGQKNLLKLLMGMPLEDQLTLIYDSASLLTENLLAPPEYKTFADVQLLDTQKDLQHLAQKSVYSDYLPSVKAFANFQFQAQRDRFSIFQTGEEWFSNHVIGVNLDVPIFSGFEKKSRIEQFKIREEEIDFNLSQQQKKLALQYQNALNEYQNNLSGIQAQRANISVAESVFSSTKLQYQEGITPLSELLSAESALREAHNALNRTFFDLKIAELKLLQAQGRIKTLVN